MSKNLLLLSLFTLSSILPARAQEVEITAQKQRLLILPSTVDDDPQSIENEATGIISDLATSLKRFEVIDRNHLKAIVGEQALHLSGLVTDSMVVAVGNIAAAREALIVDVVNFYQEGVPPSDEEEEDEDEDEDGSIWDQIALTIVEGIVQAAVREKEEESDPFSHNIQSTLSVQVKKVDIETGKSLDSFTITTAHTGGNRGFSRAKVVGQFRRQALTELKKLYTLTSEVISVSGREALLFLGSDIGVKQGTLFEIVRPDRAKTIRGHNVVIPGRRVGIVSVKSSSQEANRSIILRNWRPVRPGDRALEYTRSSLGFQINYFNTNVNPFSGIRLGFVLRPLHQSFFGGDLRFAYTTDSYQDTDFVFGFGGFGGRRFMGSSRLSFAGKLGLNLDLAFRPDIDHKTVVAALFSATPQLGFELLLAENRDLTVMFGYRLSPRTSHWTYSEEDDEGNPKQVEAEWEDSPPSVDISGLFLTVGMKFISF